MSAGPGFGRAVSTPSVTAATVPGARAVSWWAGARPLRAPLHAVVNAAIAARGQVFGEQWKCLLAEKSMGCEQAVVWRPVSRRACRSERATSRRQRRGTANVSDYLTRERRESPDARLGNRRASPRAGSLPGVPQYENGVGIHSATRDRRSAP